jgi:hypothetical protein
MQNETCQAIEGRGVAVLRDAAVPEIGQFATIQAMASSLGVDVSPINAHDAVECAKGLNRSRGRLLRQAPRLSW